MDSECSSLTDVKALNQSVISGASPTFSTANMTDAENKRFMSDAQENKLDGIEASADVTDTTNVTAAGALMDSECSSLTDVKALNQSVISGATPTFTGTNFTGIPDGGLTLTDVVTNNVSTSAHGFCPKAPNDTGQYLRGDASWSALTGAFKEYGLDMTTGTDTDHDIDIAAGARWDSTCSVKITYAGGTIAIDASGAGGLDTGSVANSTQYYVWICSGGSGTTAIFSASASAPTLPGGYDSYKVCIGRVITNDSANIDNDKFWTKYPDKTEVFRYIQSTGNFPAAADITVDHNLNSYDVIGNIWAKANSGGALYPFCDNDIKNYDAISFESANTICKAYGSSGNWTTLGTGGTSTIAGSSDYRLVAYVKTLKG
jgi:hypothetical protein